MSHLLFSSSSSSSSLSLSSFLLLFPPVGTIPATAIFEQRRDITAELNRKTRRHAESVDGAGELNQGAHVFGVDDRKVFKNQTYPWYARQFIRESCTHSSSLPHRSHALSLNLSITHSLHPLLYHAHSLQCDSSGLLSAVCAPRRVSAQAPSWAAVLWSLAHTASHGQPREAPNGSRLLFILGASIYDLSSLSSLSLSFTPAYYRGEEPFGSSGVANVLVYVKISGAMTNLQSAFDQAVLVLDDPLGERAGYVGYTTFRKEWLGKPYWYNIGYPIELHQSAVPVISSEGSIDFLDEYSIQSWRSYLLGTFIDMTGGMFSSSTLPLHLFHYPGHSGGPVWGFFGNETFPRVVALISSESATKGKDKDGDNNLSGGPALTHLINHARSIYEEETDNE